MKLIRKSGVILPTNHPQFESIERDLNRNLVGFNQELYHLCFCKNIEEGILIPRFYPLPLDIIKDDIPSGQTIKIESNIVPRNIRQEKSIDFLTNNRNGILKLEPGTGKTVIAIAAISNIKKKTIIFVHKNSLRKQWTDEFLNFTNLKEEEISHLTTKTFEEDLKKPIIIATVQGLCALLKKKDIDFQKILNKSDIGVSIFDEVHTTIGPEQFTKASLSLNCKRVYGLSATPTRSDGLEDIIGYHLGKVTYFQPTKNELMKPKVFMIYFNFNIYSKHKRYLRWGGGFSTGRYYQQMHKSQEYNITVSKFIKKLYNQGRNILVLGVRKNALLTLASSIGVKPPDIGVFIPGSTSEERLEYSDTDDLTKAFLEKRIVFSTYLAGRDGNNRKSLDTLVMTVPTGNVEQAAGRILRTLEGKKVPYILDLIDIDGPPIKSYSDNSNTVPWFVKSSEKREELYEKMGWEIEKIQIEKNNIIYHI